MSLTKIPTFSQIVCNAEPVRGAFASHWGTRLWWNLILKLHGKPVTTALSSLQRTQRIADGFKFYALLYRILAFVFLLPALAFAILSAEAEGTPFIYWAGASMGATLYLWGASSLGWNGAITYRHNPAEGRIALLAFMVMIVAFLSLFVGAVSVAVHYASGVSVLPNLAAATLLFIFGIGSYGIEIIYLASEKELSPHEKS